MTHNIQLYIYILHTSVRYDRMRCGCYTGWLVVLFFHSVVIGNPIASREAVQRDTRTKCTSSEPSVLPVALLEILTRQPPFQEQEPPFQEQERPFTLMRTLVSWRSRKWACLGAPKFCACCNWVSERAHGHEARCKVAWGGDFSRRIRRDDRRPQPIIECNICLCWVVPNVRKAGCEDIWRWKKSF